MVNTEHLKEKTFKRNSKWDKLRSNYYNTPDGKSALLKLERKEKENPPISRMLDATQLTNIKQAREIIRGD